jgi:hypothetical protein
VNKLIDTGAVAAAYCVADESIDAFRRFHAARGRRRCRRDETPAAPGIAGCRG